jgi:predicted nucleic acid-binding protein
VAAARGIVVLTDDRDARTVAGSLGVQVSGTLGVLSHLVEMGALAVNEADGLLTEMIRAGYRSPVASLTEIS